MVPLPHSVIQLVDIYFTQNALNDTFKFNKSWKDCSKMCDLLMVPSALVLFLSARSVLLLMVPPISDASEHAERVLSDYNIDSKLDCGRTSQFRARAEAIVHFREVEKLRTKRAEEREPSR